MICRVLHGDYSLDMWFSPDGSELYGFSYQGAKTEKIYFDEYFATVNKSLEAAFPGNEVSVFDWSDDLTRFLFGVQSDKDPGCLLYTSPSPRDWTISRMPSSA